MKEQQLSSQGKPRRNYWLGMAFTLISAALWGSTYPVIQLSLSYYNAFDISLYRALFAALTLTIYFAVRRKHLQLLPRRQDIPLLLLASVFGATGFWTLLNVSVLFLEADTASFLVALYPLLAVVLASLLLHERMTTLRAVGIALGILGTLIIVAYGQGAGFAGSQPIVGALIAFLAAFSWAGYMITTKLLIGRRNSTTGELINPEYVTYNTFLLAIPPTAVLVLLTGSGPGFVVPSAPGLLYMSYLGVLTSALAFLIFNRGIKLIGVTGAAINQLIFPAVAVVISYFALGEVINIPDIAGMGLIALGIVMAQVLSKN